MNKKGMSEETWTIIYLILGALAFLFIIFPIIQGILSVFSPGDETQGTRSLVEFEVLDLIAKIGDKAHDEIEIPYELKKGYIIVGKMEFNEMANEDQPRICIYKDDMSKKYDCSKKSLENVVFKSPQVIKQTASVKPVKVSIDKIEEGKYDVKFTN